MTSCKLLRLSVDTCFYLSGCACHGISEKISWFNTQKVTFRERRRYHGNDQLASRGTQRRDDNAACVRSRRREGQGCPSARPRPLPDPEPGGREGSRPHPLPGHTLHPFSSRDAMQLSGSLLLPPGASGALPLPTRPSGPRGRPHRSRGAHVRCHRQRFLGHIASAH